MSDPRNVESSSDVSSEPNANNGVENAALVWSAGQQNMVRSENHGGLLQRMFNSHFQPADMDSDDSSSESEVAITLPTVVITQEDCAQKTQCSVCCDPFSVAEQVKELRCTHKFHEECLLLWLKEKKSCPVCRQPLTCDDIDHDRDSGADDVPSVDAEVN